MNSVFLFPGINSVTRVKDRRNYLHLTEVQQRLRLADVELKKLGETRSLRDHLLLDPVEICRTSNLALTSTCVVAIQLGITDRLNNRGIFPDFLMGCSMGDLARSVYGGVISFEESLLHGYDFVSRAIEEANRLKGVNLGMRAPALTPFAQTDMDWFEAHGINVSWMSPNNVQASCDESAYKILCKKADAMNWRTNRFPFNVMFHARQLREFSRQAFDNIEDSSLSEPRLKTFSSILKRPVSTIGDFRLEAKASIWRPVNWYESLVALHEKYQVRRFINIGPDRSLIALHRNIFPKEPAIDALTLLA